MGTAGAPARTADLCAQALSRCPASQIGRLLGPWSRFEAIQYVARTAAAGGGGGGISAVGGGGGGTAAVASALVEGGMDEDVAKSLGRALTIDDHGEGKDDETCQSSGLDRHLAAGGGEDIFGGGGSGGPGRAAEVALRFLLLREHGLSSSSPAPIPGGAAAGAEDRELAATGPQGCAGPAAIPAAVAEGEGEPEDVLQKATNRLCILLALAELRSDTGEPGAVVDRGPSAADHGGSDGVSRAEGEIGAGTAAAGKKVSEGGVEDRPGRWEEENGAAAGGGGAVALARLAREAAEEFGIGAVERGVGYALAASDGRAVLGALRALLEGAEGRVKALRDAAAAGVEQSGGAGGAAVGLAAGEEDGEVREWKKMNMVMSYVF